MVISVSVATHASRPLSTIGRDGCYVSGTALPRLTRSARSRTSESFGTEREINRRTSRRRREMTPEPATEVSTSRGTERRALEGRHRCGPLAANVERCLTSTALVLRRCVWLKAPRAHELAANPTMPVALTRCFTAVGSRSFARRVARRRRRASRSGSRLPFAQSVSTG